MSKIKNDNTMTEFKLFLDFDKELAYINEMNKNGWKLVYIKWGCYYTFTKTEPDEYFTILHAESKENISSITAFAAQCGYENIPHTMDGFGEMMYLTGKKDEVSKDFVSDSHSQIETYKKIHNKMHTFSIIYIILCAMFVIEELFIGFLTFTSDFDAGLLGLFTVMTLVFIFFIGATFIILKTTRRFKKKIKDLQSESNIFE